MKLKIMKKILSLYLIIFALSSGAFGQTLQKNVNQATTNAPTGNNTGDQFSQTPQNTLIGRPPGGATTALPQEIILGTGFT
jgi:predicted S18 family serine protease